MKKNMDKELPKIYEPQKIESEIYERWEKSGFFNPDNLEGSDRYCNVLPPPNANGELHLGHASGYTVMDIFGRYARMNGKKTLLLPGKDHAGIQTQVVFEKILEKEKETDRHRLGREKFYQATYDFCIGRANYMRSQEKRIGISADWSRERFTLDPLVLKPAMETFIRMHEDGLIYKGKRIINWCPRCATALSDVEVLHKEMPGKLYYIKYPLENSSDFVTVATTRPETMLGDSAVAVGPDDKRYSRLVGKKLVLPLQNRIIPVIADKRIDVSFGTGAVKITPSHDPLDWEIGKDHKLENFDVIDEKATITDLGGKYAGLSTIEARQQIIADLEKLGLLEKMEEMTHSVSICERCKTIIEPLTSSQWFVNVDAKKFSLKKKAVAAVKKGDINIFPANFQKVLIDWFDNMRDWCISRQIWWGPRFPVWYCENCGEEKYIVSLEKPSACPHCGDKKLFQDENTFDTWFTSGQWAHTTLQSHGKDFKDFYPSDMMVMGRDILFFWSARMIMLGLYSTGQVPFKNLFFTGLIRDKDGFKMSKSRGNGIEPLLMIDKFGADALRMSFIMDSAPGQDSRLYEEKIETFRNFANKLWNISRYCLSQEGFRLQETISSEDIVSAADYWILQKLNETINNVSNLFDKKQISLAADILKTFTWNEFADWYIEISKVENNIRMLGYVLDKIMRMWHPFMPFVTEYTWELALQNKILMISSWPKSILKDFDSSLHTDIGYNLVEKHLKPLITEIRNVRTEHKFKSNKKITVFINSEDKKLLNEIKLEERLVRGLKTGIESIVYNRAESELTHGIKRVINDKITIHIYEFGGTFEINGMTVKTSLDNIELKDDTGFKEKMRVEKKIANLEDFISRLKERLKNDSFISKAPKQVIDQQKETLSNKEAELAELKKHLASLR